MAPWYVVLFAGACYDFEKELHRVGFDEFVAGARVLAQFVQELCVFLIENSLRNNWQDFVTFTRVEEKFFGWVFVRFRF